MASNRIRTVLFDLGGTLEELYNDEAIRQEATRGPRLRRRYAVPRCHPCAGAGYGLVIRIKSFLTDKAGRTIDCVLRDAVIHDLNPVVDLVTPRTETVHEH